MFWASFYQQNCYHRNEITCGLLTFSVYITTLQRKRLPGKCFCTTYDATWNTLLFSFGSPSYWNHAMISVASRPFHVIITGIWTNNTNSLIEVRFWDAHSSVQRYHNAHENHHIHVIINHHKWMTSNIRFKKSSPLLADKPQCTTVNSFTYYH